jgi:hypothetical protein
MITLAGHKSNNNNYNNSFYSLPVGVIILMLKSYKKLLTFKLKNTKTL